MVLEIKQNFIQNEQFSPLPDKEGCIAWSSQLHWVWTYQSNCTEKSLQGSGSIQDWKGKKYPLINLTKEDCKHQKYTFTIRQYIRQT